MSKKRRATKGLGHHVGSIISGGDILQIDVFSSNNISDEVKLDAKMPCAKRSLSSSCNLETGFIIFTNESGTRRWMTKFSEKLSEIQCFSSGETKGNVFGFSRGFGNGVLKFAPTGHSTTAKSEDIARD